MKKPLTAQKSGAIQGVEFMQKHPEIILVFWLGLAAWGMYTGNGTGGIVCIFVGALGYAAMRNSKGFDQMKFFIEHS